jgi:ribosome maturation factor RimP
VGRVVDVRLFEPQDGRRHLRGALTAVEGEELCVDEAGVVTRVAFARVKGAHLVHEFPEVGLGAK